MTLIITHISRHGIIHASDSNLTAGDGKDAGTGQKTFGILSLNAGLTVAGNYSVGGVSMNLWMNNFISASAKNRSLTLHQFVQNLHDEVQMNMTNDEKDNGSIFHIAGYVEDGHRSHPEFYVVQNVHGIDAEGEYINLDHNFDLSEDFWARDCPANNIMSQFANSSDYSAQLYINGFSAGRIGYNAVSDRLNKLFIDIWQNSKWKFRPPQTIDDMEIILELCMNVVNGLFMLSDYSAKIVGGKIQTYKIPQPTNIVLTP